MAAATPLRTHEWLALGGLSLGTALTFAATFRFGWVYDDVPQIPQNENLQWSRLGFLFTHHLWASAANSGGRFYRPLLTVWFLINKSLFGLNPHAFHVTTVLAHVLATALAFFVARSLLLGFGSSLFAAAIFALHPLQAEPASWISSVNDSLAAALCFASFLFYRKGAGRTNEVRWWAASGVFFLLALLTKEVSIVLPGIILVDLFAHSAGPPGNPFSKAFAGSLVRSAVVYGTVAVMWLTLRSWAIGNAAEPSAVSPPAYLISIPKIILFNLSRIVLPLRLSPHYDFHLIDSFYSAQGSLSYLALLMLAVLAVAVGRHNRGLSVALAWLIFPMIPTLNLHWMNQNDFIHDRYLYMSVLGAALLAAEAYDSIRRKWPEQKLVRPVAVGLAVLLAFASATQSQYWASDVVLFARAVEVSPGNEWAQLNYGSALSSRGRYSQAVPHFVRSYEIDPGWRAASFAGFAFQQAGDLSQAERWFNTALRLDPNLANAWFGLAQIRLTQNRPADAVRYLKDALRMEPSADGYHYEMGVALEQLNQKPAAAEEYKTELQLHPYQTGARKALDRLNAGETNR